ncbi:MAG TPA: hypothetical protein VHG72_14365 [Polyangia bacterium]|nr:hypothetical protein [Polyangia bacterium]
MITSAAEATGAAHSNSANPARPFFQFDILKSFNHTLLSREALRPRGSAAGPIFADDEAGVVKVKDELTLSWHIRGRPR